MCDPITLLVAAGGAVSAAGSIYGGQAGARANKLNADIARMNAETMLQQAEIEKEFAQLPLLKGAFETLRVRRAGERAEGSQVAGFASVGFDPTSGSPLLVQAATAAQIETDAALIDAQAKFDYAGALAKRARTVAGAAGAFGSAAGYEARSSDALVAGYLGAASSLLLAGSKVNWPSLSTNPTAASSTGFEIA